ncbi:MAG TPA: serine hydrolase domain-containing protein [Pirellulales bacterium]|nr:serine hydrolase domain-containing protein [Pirellulales bacterium]
MTFGISEEISPCAVAQMSQTPVAQIQEQRAAEAQVQRVAEQIPVTGEILPGSEALDRLDDVVKQILARHQVAGAGVAVTRGGKLIVARGYGWADIEAHDPMQPTTLVGLASVSKPITGVTILKLVEQGRLRLDDHVFPLLGELRAPPEKQVDPQLKEITVRTLLEHAGGWDRSKSGDPCTFGQKVHTELNVPLPITIDQLIYYMNGQPFDFAPGTEQKYSNYGFAILGRVIERVTGQPYVQYVEQNTLGPMGIRGIKMSNVGRPDNDVGYLQNEAKRYIAGTTKALPLGKNPAAAPAGGWSGSAVALARFLTAVDGTRTGKTFLDPATMQEMLARPEPPLQIRKNGGWFGLGWDTVREMPNWPFHDEPIDDRAATMRERDRGIANLAYSKNGGLPGISTWIQHLPGGIDWVILFNSSKPTAKPEETEHPADAPQGNALQDAQKEVVELIRNINDWPRGDLFEKYR